MADQVVTIDGPSGVGKSTITRKVAAIIGFAYLDTGAMYRAVGLYLGSLGTDLTSEDKIDSALESMNIELIPATTEDDDVGVLLNGKDISSEIRTSEAAMVASLVSALPVVRIKLTAMQREIGRKGKIVAEGRDTGTVVFPNAEYKFYLDANPEERARRRIKQLKLKGEKVDKKEILSLIIKRDKDDQQRAFAPLKKAKDALLIDTSDLSIEMVVETMINQINKKKKRICSAKKTNRL